MSLVIAGWSKRNFGSREGIAIVIPSTFFQRIISFCAKTIEVFLPVQFPGVLLKVPKTRADLFFSVFFFPFVPNFGGTASAFWFCYTPYFAANGFNFNFHTGSLTSLSSE